MKLEPNEVAILLNMMMESQIRGKDAIIIGKLLEKLQKEMEKLAPNTLGNNGKK